jgi:FkbM family methyltransferase
MHVAMFPQRLKSLVSSRRTGRRMREDSPLPEAMQARTVAALATLDALPDDARETELLGFRVAFQSPRVLWFLFHEIFVEHTYFFESTAPQPVIIDAGANIGLATLFFKTLHPEARIVCFEPDPDNFILLTRNVERNRLSHVELHQSAVSDTAEPIVFYTSPSDSPLRHSTVEARVASPEHIVVPAVRLSTYVGEDVDLLKLDVEGSERQVLPELIASGAIGRIKRMHLEYHHHIESHRNDLSATLAQLERAGFGYQLRADQHKWPVARAFQDVSIYAYREV